MKLMIATLACLSCGATAGPIEQTRVSIEPGATLNVVLSEKLDSRKRKIGDPVKVRVVEDLMTGGVVVIPRGSHLLAHITEIEVQSRLGLSFDAVLLKKGGEIAVHGVLLAIAAPERSAQDEGVLGSDFGASLGGDSVAGVARAASDDASESDDRRRDRHEVLRPSPGAVGGLDNRGLLSASSRGVFGLPDITLESGASVSAGGSTILTTTRSVRLASGTRLLLSLEVARPSP